MHTGNLDAIRHLSLLTKDERQRLEAAICRYLAVMEHNLEQEWAMRSSHEREAAARPWWWETMSEADREKWTASYEDDPKAAWRASAQQMASISSGGLNGKSSLLRRLLLGQRPLRWRAPTAYSYPFYSLVESDKPVHATTVGLHGIMSVASELRGSGGAKHDPSDLAKALGIEDLTVNQTSYEVTGANEAGISLVKHSLAMMSSPDGQIEDWVWKDGKGHVRDLVPRITKNHELWPEIVQAYNDGPEFELRHGYWPAWKLSVGRRSRNCTATFAQECIEKGPWGTLAYPNPMDLAFAHLNLSVDECAAADVGDAAEVADHSLERIEAVLAGMRPEERRQHAKSLNAMSEDAAAREQDNVCISDASWMLSKTAEWGCLTESDMYISDEELEVLSKKMGS